VVNAAEVCRGELGCKIMARGPSAPTSTKPGANNGFTAEENSVAWLLAGFDSDRTKWSDHTAAEASNVRAMSLFFCPLMGKLRRRGKTIEKACKRHTVLASLGVQRRPFNTLARGEPVTLDRILHVYDVLNAIADCNDEAVKATTKVERRNKAVCLVLEENDVIPSHIWVNRSRITDFCNHFDITRKKLAELMFDDGKYDDFFQTLEDGERKKGDKEKEVVEYDFRVTPFTRDCIFFTLNKLYDSLSRLPAASEFVLPSLGQLFETSAAAGLGAYNRTKALPMEKGNLTRAITPAQKASIEARIKAFAKKKTTRSVSEDGKRKK
jgi:hypothetical protein